MDFFSVRNNMVLSFHVNVWSGKKKLIFSRHVHKRIVLIIISLCIIHYVAIRFIDVLYIDLLNYLVPVLSVLSEVIEIN